MQKVMLAAIVLGLVFGGAYYWKHSGTQVPETIGQVPAGKPSVEIPMETVYYYGAECPHCKDVSAFLDENKIAEKVKFEKKEVWHDTVNAKEMEDRAKICGLDVKNIGVPFVYADGKCHIGTPEVESFFKAAAGM